MARHSLPTLVSTIEDVQVNIRNFERELKKDDELVRLLGTVHAWYAHRTADGIWIFGPSKFVGYKKNTAGQYNETAKLGAHGGETERKLSKWFDRVEPATPLGHELSEALKNFLARWGRTPRAGARINVLRTEKTRLLSGCSVGENKSRELIARVSADPRICGGRPCIRGTRMRVADIVEAMANGATPDEILRDFDYLTEEDLAAALLYAARAADHRVIRTA